MKALKLKLLPTKEQQQILDEMFNKWASICTRMSYKNIEKEKIAPPDNGNGIWFNKTQLNQAETDVKDLKKAMQKQAEQKERELEKIKDRYRVISETLRNNDKRDIDPRKSSNFRPKEYVSAGLLKTKFHTQNYYQKELENLERAMTKREKTIGKIKKGNIYFKPKRIGLWPTSFSLSFTGKKFVLKTFPRGDAYQKPIEIYMVTEPLQPVIGKDRGLSSQKSKDYISHSIKQFITFSLHSRFFGMNDTEKILMKLKINKNIILYRKKNFTSDGMLKVLENKVKRSFEQNEKELFYSEFNKFSTNKNNEFSKLYLELIEKLSNELKERKLALLNKKFLSLDQKIKDIKKIINNDIDSTIIKKEFQMFKRNVDNYVVNYHYSEEYVNYMLHLTDILYNKKDVFDVNKYPILIRKPINRYRKKQIKNLAPEQWKYYIQLSYEPLEIKQEFKEKSVMGIDRGLTHLLAISVFNPETNRFSVNRLVENPIAGWKWKLRKMKMSIQHLERRTRAQKNVHIFENQMKKRFRSLENRIENLYHNLSGEIIETAKANSAVIVLENLERQGLKQHGRKKNSGMRSLNYALSLFDYAKIASLIKYKAEDAGIPVFGVEAAGTSQNCAKCILERGSLTEQIKLCFIEDIKPDNSLPMKLSEDLEIINSKVKIMKKNEFLVSVIDKNNNNIDVLFKKGKKLSVKMGENVIREYDISNENNKTAILTSIYRRDSYNKKIGKCGKHGQIDADLNAARVIALCYHKKINDPVPFDSRKGFK